MDIRDTDAIQIWQPSAEQLDNVRMLAALRYPMSKIAVFLEISEAELRRQIQNKESAISKAYYHGKIESELKYRNTVREQAEKGVEWAVNMVQLWEQEQHKEELGFLG